MGGYRSGPSGRTQERTQWEDTGEDPAGGYRSGPSGRTQGRTQREDTEEDPVGGHRVGPSGRTQGRTQREDTGAGSVGVSAVLNAPYTAIGGRKYIFGIDCAPQS